jgi:hypothetical protein
MRNPQYRFGEVTAAQIVPMVISELLQLISDPKIERDPRRREADQRCLISILDELDNMGGRQ